MPDTNDIVLADLARRLQLLETVVLDRPSDGGPQTVREKYEFTRTGEGYPKVHPSEFLDGVETRVVETSPTASAVFPVFRPTSGNWPVPVFPALKHRDDQGLGAWNLHMTPSKGSQGLRFEDLGSTKWSESDLTDLAETQPSQDAD